MDLPPFQSPHLGPRGVLEVVEGRQDVLHLPPPLQSLQTAGQQPGQEGLLGGVGGGQGGSKVVKQSAGQTLTLHQT